MAAGEAQLLGDTAHLAHVSADGGGGRRRRSRTDAHTGKHRDGLWEGEQQSRAGTPSSSRQTHRQRLDGSGGVEEVCVGGELYLRGPSAGSAAMRAASWQDAEAARLTHV